MGIVESFFQRIKAEGVLVEGPPYIVEKRSWGISVVLDANTRIHCIEGEPSLHFHRYRTEDYILYSGSMAVYRGHVYEGDLEKTVANLQEIIMSPGDRIVTPPMTVHVPINLSPGGSSYIEISHGPYAEGDVERVYDKSGREPSLLQKWTELGYESGISIVDLIPMAKDRLKNK